ncbi:hypothetical protein ACFLU6_13250 [Acidobacteriota bacterium]
MSLECRFVRKIWKQTLHEQTDPILPREIQNHLDFCESCRREISEDISIRTLFRESRIQVRPPEELPRKVMDRIDLEGLEPKRYMPGPSRAFLAAFFSVCAIVIVVLTLLNINQHNHNLASQREMNGTEIEPLFFNIAHLPSYKPLYGFGNQIDYGARQRER